MRLAVLFSLAAGLAAVPVSAEIVSFTAGGTLSSVEYDFGGPASAAFLAGTPIGSAYKLNFSYDTAAPSTFFGWYPGIATADFTLDGTTFTLAPTDVTVNGGGFAMNNRFGLFGNFALNQPTLNGFRPIDLHFDLIDSTNQAFSGPALPATLDLADFDNRRLRIRFVGAQGETGLFFTVTSLTSGAAVPEPATWALMLSGFGLAGAAVRRRARVSVTYA